MLVELNENNFNENVETGLKLVEFYTTWCGHCNRQKSVIIELANNNIWIGTINADENPELTHAFQVQGFPTFILFKDGKILANLSGYYEKSQLLTKLMEYLK